ncbi:uncharacterized protein LOC142334786 isoform X2 [Convolutriloba macropyga]|uniref:uncharacterized protein LOC142334786 isoform X2 n=1 Tax=Convolutriloba macropyga TaxID=536237 RepID=UPI003F51D2CF
MKSQHSQSYNSLLNHVSLTSSVALNTANHAVAKSACGITSKGCFNSQHFAEPSQLSPPLTSSSGTCLREVQAESSTSSPAQLTDSDSNAGLNSPLVNFISMNGALSFLKFDRNFCSGCPATSYKDKRNSRTVTTSNFFLFTLFLILSSTFGAQASSQPSDGTNNSKKHNSALSSKGGDDSSELKCEPYFDGHRRTGTCAKTKFIDQTEEIMIDRPGVNAGCEKCVTRVTAHEASHFLSVEFKTIVIQKTSSVEQFRCHTCLCGVLSIYDGEFLIGEWCYGRLTSKFLTSNSRSLSFVYKTERDYEKPNATFHLIVKPVPISRTKIIEVDPSETGIVSGSLFTQGFPGSAYFPSPDGLQIWMFVNRRPNTTLRLKFNDIFLQPPQLVGFCNNDFINIFHGPPQVSDTWHSMLCDRNFPEDLYFSSEVVSVVFAPTNFGSTDDYANGFNFSYTFFNRNVTGHKHLDCGEFNNSENAYGQGFMLPPGGQMQVKRKVAPVESATSQSTALVDGGESDQHAAAHSPRMMNADLRCHWRVVSPGVYDRFIITITNFTVNPLSNTGETMAELETDILPAPNSKEWSKSLKEPVGLKLFDGIYSRSRVLTEHLVTDSIQPGNRPAFYVTQSNTVRIDVSYPTTTLGIIGFGYAAIRELRSDSDSCDSYKEFKCGGVKEGDKAVGGNTVRFDLGDYCIRRELLCDNVPNCIRGEDEEMHGMSKCTEPVTDPAWPREGGMDGLTVTLIVLLVVLCILLGLFIFVFVSRRAKASSRRGSGVSCSAGNRVGGASGRHRDSNGNVLATSNPASQSTAVTTQAQSNGSSNGALSNSSQSASGTGSSSGRNSRHNSGDNASVQMPPQIVDHDPHVSPQPIYIAKTFHLPPPYDLLYHNKRLESVDEETETEYGANSQTEANDKAFLLRFDSGKGESDT